MTYDTDIRRIVEWALGWYYIKCKAIASVLRQLTVNFEIDASNDCRKTLTITLRLM